MPIPHGSRAVAVALALVGVAAVSPAAFAPTANASPDKTQPITTHATLAAKLEKVLRHHGAKHLDYEIYDPTYGTFASNAKRLSAPASNEKIFTAITILQAVGANFRYTTPVAGTTKLTTHTLHGDLVVRGSGDPTLSRGDLLAMAKRLHRRGLHHVSGHLIVDDSRYSKKTIVDGWKHKFVPSESGTMDAFTVDHNVWRGGKSFINNPTLGNARLFRHELKRRHITFGKRIEVRRAPATVRPLVKHHSPTIASIIQATLTDSINFDAEMMFREAGAQLTGHGSPKTGLEAEQQAAAQLGVPVGVVHDGSGLSYTDRSTPALLTAWLYRAKTTPYYASFYYGLPLSCRTGTLKYRMCGPHVAGEVRAKTGTLNHVSTLSGYVTSESGHPVTFSFLASGITSYSKLYDAVDNAIALFRKRG